MELKKSIKTMALTSIRPYWRNPRINDKAVDAVIQSIKDYGYNQPIVVDSEHVIVVGHTRYRALMKMGVEKADVVVRDFPPEKAKAYRIADNKSGDLAEYDQGKLMAELREIPNIDDMQIYFGDTDIAALLEEAAGSVEANFNLPTNEQIAKVEQQLAATFEQRSEQAAEAYVEIHCPHCGEKSYVDREEVLRRPPASLPSQ